MLELTIYRASYHRNGIGGQGFYAIIFDDREQGRMIASLFDDPGYCAVYNIGYLTEDNIAFAQGNSWRGDAYEDALRPLLADWLKHNGSNRAGPFAFPDAPSKETGHEMDDTK